MQLEEIKNFFKNNISYKAGWDFLIKEKNGVPYLQIQFNGADNFTGKVERQYCRKWQLSEWMTPTELVETAWAAVQRAEMHEAKETFKFKGQAVYNSHLNVEKLVQLCQSNDATEHRPEPPKVEKELSLNEKFTWMALDVWNIIEKYGQYDTNETYPDTNDADLHDGLNELLSFGMIKAINNGIYAKVEVKP